MSEDLRLGPKLSEGRTAEIHAWQPGWVLKLYRDWLPPDDAEHEAHVTRAAHYSGFAAPAIGDIIRIGERTGLVMEHIKGPDMLAELLAQPWRIDRYARWLAELHLRMHQCMPRGLPDQHERLARRLEAAPGLSSEQRAQLLDRLGALPRGNALCHGDLHPLNVILSAQGPVVIDWVDATRGNPLADVARTTILFSLGGLPDQPLKQIFIRLFRSRFLLAYHRRYFASDPSASQEHDRWLPIVAAARLTEGIAEENPRLLAAVERWLA